jgi:hypothetical protein
LFGLTALLDEDEGTMHSNAEVAGMAGGAVAGTVALAAMSLCLSASPKDRAPLKVPCRHRLMTMGFRPQIFEFQTTHSNNLAHVRVQR